MNTTVVACWNVGSKPKDHNVPLLFVRTSLFKAVVVSALFATTRFTLRTISGGGARFPAAAVVQETAARVFWRSSELGKRRGRSGVSWRSSWRRVPPQGGRRRAVELGFPAAAAWSFGQVGSGAVSRQRLQNAAVSETFRRAI